MAKLGQDTCPFNDSFQVVSRQGENKSTRIDKKYKEKEKKDKRRQQQ